jgi:4-hydroxybutyrate dehydrogenase
MMKQFTIKPVIQLYETFSEFLAEVQPGPCDLIFTVKFLNDAWLKPLRLSSHILLFEDYGSGEPSDEMIDLIFADMRKLPVRRIIAIGGGSVIDISKLLGLKNTGNALDFFGKTVEIIKEKELIIVPTTCGTGSEVTNIAVAGIKSRNSKMGLTHEALYADRAVLISELIASLPDYVYVTSALDALVHAMESFVSPKSTIYSELFSANAVRMLLDNFKIYLREGRQASIPRLALTTMVASNYAGVAFSNTGVGAVHALSYPLGGKYHVPHGEANARFLMVVCCAYQSKEPRGKIRDLGIIIASALELPSWQDPWKALEQVVNTLLPHKPLREYGMKEEEIETFATGVYDQQQRLLVNNYVPLSRDEIRDLFKKLW